MIPPWIKRAQTKRPDNTTNQKIKSEVYNTHKWKTYSKKYRTSNPVCAMCGREHYDIKKLDLDHVVPISQGGSIWHPANHQSLCKHKY